MKVIAGLLLATSLAGCSRWEPPTKGPVELSRACPLKRAPPVADFGRDGVQGAYHFVIEGASDEDVKALLHDASAAGFGVVPMTVNIDGKDTLFANGPSSLRTQDEVDDEFDLACGFGRGKVYLTFVRYNFPDPASSSLRVR